MNRTMAMPPPPVVYITVEDRACRAAIVDALHRQGWAAIAVPSGFHVVQALADVIEGRPALQPGLIVVDAVSRGCSGISIARGLRELDIAIPIVIVARPGDPVDHEDAGVHVVRASHAPSAVAEIARPLSPCRALDALALPERPIA